MYTAQAHRCNSASALPYGARQQWATTGRQGRGYWGCGVQGSQSACAMPAVTSNLALAVVLSAVRAPGTSRTSQQCNMQRGITVLVGRVYVEQRTHRNGGWFVLDMRFAKSCLHGSRDVSLPGLSSAFNVHLPAVEA
jgi:hypothetical protein